MRNKVKLNLQMEEDAAGQTKYDFQPVSMPLVRCDYFKCAKQKNSDLT